MSEQSSATARDSIPPPLPIRPRPMPGESTISYIRRLAHANHLRASHLRRHLSQPDTTEPIRVQWLAALSGRTVTTLERAPPDLTTENHPRSSARVHLHRGEKPAMFTTIRQDAHDQGGSIRALADRHGVHRRIIRQALLSPHPAPRKKIVRGSRFDPFKDVIAEMLQPQPPARRPTIQQIHDRLIAEHGMAGISYSALHHYIPRKLSL